LPRPTTRRAGRRRHAQRGEKVAILIGQGARRRPARSPASPT
jgi:hypothetical protein